jgi:spore maturation protein CgeB
VLWRDYDDLRQKLAYYLDPAHETERARIARTGQAEVLRNHSFEARVQRPAQCAHPAG